MDLIELGSVLGDFFESGAGPSHNELDIAFSATGLTDLDPAPGGATSRGLPLGKTKRIRQALTAAGDSAPDRGMRFALHIVALLRSDGMLRPPLDSFETARVDRLRDALARLGMTLHADGGVSAIVIDNLAGTALTEALQAHVGRLNANPDDPALLIGSGKDLDEAAARHVLIEKMGSYETRGRGASFPVTLAGAFTANGMSIAPVVKLDDDPHRAVQQALFLLGVEVNRLRNEVGTGHGRPTPSSRTAMPTAAEARLIARATALVAGALLDAL